MHAGSAYYSDSSTERQEGSRGYRSAVLQRIYARGARITAMAARRGRKEAEDMRSATLRNVRINERIIFNGYDQ